jgi:serine protease AprX
MAENRENRKDDPFKLSRSIISIPLLESMEKATDSQVFQVIIDVNLDYIEGRKVARKELLWRIAKLEPEYNVNLEFEDHPQYIFARLSAINIRELVRIDLAEAKNDKRYRLIYKIWPDFPVSAFLNKPVRTVKADAANISFSANGTGICWAVIDTGIDRSHLHFAGLNTLDTPYSKDFTMNNGDPFLDEHGHGSHVAGIIAGGQKQIVKAAQRKTNENNQTEAELKEYPSISGIAPFCKLVSLKVLNSDGRGVASTTLKAIHYVQELNGFGRDIKIHGVNISIGHGFDPQWFACGQSPLCVEVDRLVKSGVVVVVAAGNSGYGFIKTTASDDTPAGVGLSINDPGNADLAITVGSTHKDMPHIYGVSYFSSKGPTGDGRLKPDLIAPGEKIISCATGETKAAFSMQLPDSFDYCEESGTSMAAPHVSGAIAAFLSIRQEFIGRPEKIKEIFTSTATDLKRDKYFQGSGLIDLMRAIQSV